MSIEAEQVVLVNEQDEDLGKMEKMEAHRLGRLHRAFSIFVFNSEGDLLIHQRAHEKYHSGGLWTNTCCSHPRWGETLHDAVHRRLQEEMGFDCDLEPIFHFTYRAELDHDLIEHELDHVVIGHSDTVPVPNPEEVADYRYVSLEELQADIAANGHLYTAWLKIALPRVVDHLKTA